MLVGPQDHLALQAERRAGAACKSRANGKGGRDRAAEPHVGLKKLYDWWLDLPEDSWILCGRICHLDTHGPVHCKTYGGNLT